VIDYTSQDFTDHVRGMDGAFDLMGGETLDKVFSVVRPGGKVVTVAGLPEPLTARKDLDRGAGLAALFWLASYRLRARARRHGVGYRFLFMHPSGPELAELAGLIESGTLAPVIDKVFPFAEIDTAFAYLEAGHAKGKVIVRM
jgi:alcohol dehydrogenase